MLMLPPSAYNIFVMRILENSVCQRHELPKCEKTGPNRQQNTYQPLNGENLRSRSTSYKRFVDVGKGKITIAKDDFWCNNQYLNSLLKKINRRSMIQMYDVKTSSENSTRQTKRDVE